MCADGASGKVVATAALDALLCVVLWGVVLCLWNRCKCGQQREIMIMYGTLWYCVCGAYIVLGYVRVEGISYFLCCVALCCVVFRSVV